MSNATPSTARPQGRVDLDRLASAIRIVAGYARRIGHTGDVFLRGRGLPTFGGKPLSEETLRHFEREHIVPRKMDGKFRDGFAEGEYHDRRSGSRKP